MKQLHSLILFFGLVLGGQPQKPSFKILIAANSQTAISGDDVWVRVSIANLSNQNLDDSGGLSDRTGLDPNLQFDVRDATGKPVPKRAYPHPELDTGSPVNRIIGPGETFSEDQCVSALYDMRKPGKYFILVSMRACSNVKGAEIKSNTVTVTVEPPAKRKHQP